MNAKMKIDGREGFGNQTLKWTDNIPLITPKTRLEEVVSTFWVAVSFVGNNSGLKCTIRHTSHF